MRHSISKSCSSIVCILLSFMLLSACSANSSPEGRVSIKIESVEKEIAALQKQNREILDSLGKIHETLVELKKRK